MLPFQNVQRRFSRANRRRSLSVFCHPWLDAAGFNCSWFNALGRSKAYRHRRGLGLGRFLLDAVITISTIAYGRE